MIGDRVDTDIAFGAAAGFRTVLVLSGVTQTEDEVRELSRERPTLPRPDAIWLTLADGVRDGQATGRWPEEESR